MAPRLAQRFGQLFDALITAEHFLRISAQFHFGKLDLDRYKVLILSTHPDYWSKEMYFKLKNWVFERGGKRRSELGNPDKDEDNGKPDKGLSPRGLGTNNRTDPVYLGLQKTRLLDPTLNFLGTNESSASSAR